VIATSCDVCGQGPSPSGKVDLRVLPDGGGHACQDTAACEQRAARVSTAEDPIPCPVRGPETGHPCRKKIPAGWAVFEGHSGGHFWIDDAGAALLEGGHYDATAAVSGLPFDGHLPADCPGASCPYLPFLSPSRRTEV
jgi:hypothetical protein